MEAICTRENLNTAYKHVVKNKGAPGVDGMTTDDLLPCLKEHGQRIKEELLNGTFKFQTWREEEEKAPHPYSRRHVGMSSYSTSFAANL